MILNYSSNDFSYKLGVSDAYIRKCQQGFYIDSESPHSFFDNFIVIYVCDIFYVIATSLTEFFVYEVTDKVEKALVLKNTKYTIKNAAFEYVVLKLNNRLVKITPDLNFSKATITRKKEIQPISDHVELYECDITIERLLPILYSIRAQAYVPYEGFMSKEIFFETPK